MLARNMKLVAKKIAVSRNFSSATCSPVSFTVNRIIRNAKPITVEKLSMVVSDLDKDFDEMIAKRNSNLD